jgi:hypothetical protein
MIDRIWIWYLALAIWLGLIVAICALPVGDCMTLEISGHSAGQGIQNLSFSGDLNISIAQNGSAWNLSLQGAA